MSAEEDMYKAHTKFEYNMITTADSSSFATEKYSIPQTTKMLLCKPCLRRHKLTATHCSGAGLFQLQRWFNLLCVTCTSTRLATSFKGFLDLHNMHEFAQIAHLAWPQSDVVSGYVKTELVREATEWERGDAWCIACSWPGMYTDNKYTSHWYYV